MDALVTVLRSMRLKSALLWRARFTGRWGTRTKGFGDGSMIFHGVLEGRAFIRREAEEVELQPGDVAIVTRSDAHSMTSAAGGDTLPITQLPVREQGLLACVEHGTRGDVTRILCGSFLLDHPARSSVIELLPPLLVAAPATGSKRTWCGATLALLEEEAERDGPSARVASLADALLTHALSEVADADALEPSGLLAAARDDQIGKALALVHAEPAADWSAEKLAARVGLSRTRFFDRFTELVGEPPARYIARWRVHAAADLLRTASLSTAEVAEKVGYSSEDALARAFKRHIGIAPGEYRRNAARAH